MINTNTNTNGLQITPLHNQLTFTEWNCTVRLALHEQGCTKYITTDYTAIVQVVDDYDAEHTATLFESLDITAAISIASESTSGEKLSPVKVKLADVKKKQIAALLDDMSVLKVACELCKGWCKTFVFICSTIMPDLLEDISGMSDGCLVTLWMAINN